jgi:copper(I)-binding protein
MTEVVACEAHHAKKGSSVLQISQAWSPPAPPTVDVHAGYFTIVNHSKKARVILAASSSQYEQITVHRTTLTDGVASMQSVASLPIAAGEQVRFAPGGLHLMMLRATGKRHEGDQFPITLHFQSGETLTFAMTVTRAERAGHVSKPAMDHSMHTLHKHHKK